MLVPYLNERCQEKNDFFEISDRTGPGTDLITPPPELLFGGGKPTNMTKKQNGGMLRGPIGLLRSRSHSSILAFFSGKLGLLELHAWLIRGFGGLRTGEKARPSLPCGGRMTKNVGGVPCFSWTSISVQNRTHAPWFRSNRSNAASALF
jgi:hypothetical protein